MDSDLSACAALVERGDPERFLTIMAAPASARAVLFPIHAFNLEVARAPWVTKEPMIAQMRLQWWRDALDEIASGGMVRRHEVVLPLAQVLDAEGARVLDALVAARAADLERAPFEDAEGLWAYLDATSGGLLWAAARALGPADEATVRAAGQALGLANWFRAVPGLVAAAKLPLPDGRPEAIAALAREGLARLARARAARAKVSTPSGAALLAVGQGAWILRQVAADPSRVAEGALDRSPAGLRAGLMWRAATGRW
ncbi:squalene/phytoene synthase family protein [Mesobacterium pallidum]|uniref:squalene/phytoene synthase family protein n=1 Tax=Mesobacterium pallidum TaxID=2872037 RepID=UPI001EE2BFFC|nr:squalene/phytoene synthase family protein [Mesobacterium pallidum]